MLPSGLSMLWETVDPDETLLARFGFDGFPAALHWAGGVLAREWNIATPDRAGASSRLVISGPNAILWMESGNGPLVLKWSNAEDHFERLDASTKLMTRLDRQGVPVAAPLPSPDGRVRVVCAGPLGPLSVTVSREVAGDWLDVTDDAAVRAAGACLAELHVVLREHADDRPEPVGRADTPGGRIQRWLARSDHGRAPAASARLAAMVADLPDFDDGRQLVHNDFRAANILTRDSAIVGVLDFDEVARDHRVSDLARASVYLSTLFTDWGPTPGTVREQFHRGYQSVRPLGTVERGLLDALVLWHGIMAVPDDDDPGGWAAAL